MVRAATTQGNDVIDLHALVESAAVFACAPGQNGLNVARADFSSVLHKRPAVRASGPHERPVFLWILLRPLASTLRRFAAVFFGVACAGSSVNPFVKIWVGLSGALLRSRLLASNFLHVLRQPLGARILAPLRLVGAVLLRVLCRPFLGPLPGIGHVSRVRSFDGVSRLSIQRLALDAPARRYAAITKVPFGARLAGAVETLTEALRFVVCSNLRLNHPAKLSQNFVVA